MLSHISMAFRHILSVAFIWFLYHPSFLMRQAMILSPLSWALFLSHINTVLQLLQILGPHVQYAPWSHSAISHLTLLEKKKIFFCLVFVKDTSETATGKPSWVFIKGCRSLFLSVPIVSGMASVAALILFSNWLPSCLSSLL